MGIKDGRNYSLQSEAVERLVRADDPSAPPVTEAELGKYRAKRRFSVPEAVKVCAVKAWFYGAICYFVLWGLGLYLANGLDLLLALCLVQGPVTDLLANNAIRRMEKTKGQLDRWLLVERRGVVGLMLNVLCAFAVVMLVYGAYGLAYTVGSGAFSGVEPLLYGLLSMGFELLLILIKRTAKHIITDARIKAGKAE